MDWPLLGLFTLELCYFLSQDDTAGAVLAGFHVFGTLIYMGVTKRLHSGKSVDTTSHVATVIPIDKARRKKRF